MSKVYNSIFKICQPEVEYIIADVDVCKKNSEFFDIKTLPALRSFISDTGKNFTQF